MLAAGLRLVKKGGRMVSIIIRTKNEERWLPLCLKAVFEQDYRDFEVIIVDNHSTDMTLSKAKVFGVKVLNIDEYLPGQALNFGISAAKGEFVCCLSGHCIPVSNQWLSMMLDNFNDREVAGVYGRQEPMSFTGDFDKRDLLNVFGLDKRIQVKDSFFHNANSMIRRAIWQKVPFDDKVTNIEDRVWAKEILRQGYKIVYEPEASVYHYHGIHQDNNPQRCYNVVKILEALNLKNTKKLNMKNLNVIALIPIKGGIQYFNGKPLIEYTIERCKQSKFIKRIIVSTDNPELAKLAEEKGAEAPFLRDKGLSGDLVDLEKVLQYSLEQIESKDILPDILAILEATYPFRQAGLLDNMIQQLIDQGLDSVIPVRSEYKSCWINKDNEIQRIDGGFMPRSLKEPVYIGLIGLGCVTHPVFIREGRRLGDRVGIVKVDDPLSSIEVRNTSEAGPIEKIFSEWWKQNS